jgi:hypothetical protein
MAAVFAQMGGDTISTGACRCLSRAHRVGQAATARVPNSRNMVDINAQS